MANGSVLRSLMVGVLVLSIEQADIVELNHVYDAECRETLTQWVWWQWSGWHGEYIVRDWRLVKDASQPVKTASGWEQTISSPRRQVVRSRVYRETWTRYDVELHDRRVWPEAGRRKVGR